MQLSTPPGRKVTVIPMAIMLTMMMPNSHAFAQSTEALLDEMARCRQLTGPSDRLACLDKVADALVAKRKAGTLGAELQPAVGRPRTLGLTDPIRAADAPAAPARPAVKEISASIVAATPLSGKRWRLQLDNGQIWRTLGDLKVEPRKNASIRISVTVTGGLRASIAKGAPVYVERLR